MNLPKVRIARNCRTLDMNTKRAGPARLGVLLGVLLLVSGALIFVSGCGSSSPAVQNMYVIGADGVSVFPVTATGSATPTTIISGTNTGFSDAHRAAFDAKGNMYVTNASGGSVAVYAAGATGNATPTTTISGAATGLVGPSGIALDASGNIYVANLGGGVTVYAAGATGNATPTATISGAATGLSSPNGLALDAKGNIYVANECCDTGNGYGSVTVYAAGATGNAAPTATITGLATGLDRPHALALDSSGNIYVTNASGNSVTVYAASATGNATPTTTISGALTLLSNPNGIALDDKGNIYVTNGTSVTVYAAGSSGNVAPTATISGTNTGFSSNFLHGVTVPTKTESKSGS
jgi:hypothetical protein